MSSMRDRRATSLQVTDVTGKDSKFIASLPSLAWATYALRSNAPPPAPPTLSRAVAGTAAPAEVTVTLDSRRTRSFDSGRHSATANPVSSSIAPFFSSSSPSSFSSSSSPPLRLPPAGLPFPTALSASWSASRVGTDVKHPKTSPKEATKSHRRRTSESYSRAERGGSWRRKASSAAAAWSSVALEASIIIFSAAWPDRTSAALRRRANSRVAALAAT
mmetsp:Transcript_16497/g.47449  ORF Transcript_16497/g.47449 Transcript_16497/m.47449 type:complete len:218 (-) Transcript_16497:2223-2876(-)